MGKKGTMLAVSMVVALLTASGVAWAAVRDCASDPDVYCTGTKKADTLNGSGERDILQSLAGNDKLYGNGGDDGLVGGPGDDLVDAGEGDDEVSTNSYANPTGNDRVYGGPGDDDIEDAEGYNRVFGGEGNDYMGVVNGRTIDGGPGNDWITVGSYDGSLPARIDGRVVRGGTGADRIDTTFDNSADVIYVQDGERDTVVCGGGKDRVYYDQGVDEVNPVNCENRVGG